MYNDDDNYLHDYQEDELDEAKDDIALVVASNADERLEGLISAVKKGVSQSVLDKYHEELVDGLDDFDLNDTDFIQDPNIDPDYYNDLADFDLVDDLADTVEYITDKETKDRQQYLPKIQKYVDKFNQASLGNCADVLLTEY